MPIFQTVGLPDYFSSQLANVWNSLTDTVGPSILGGAFLFFATSKILRFSKLIYTYFLRPSRISDYCHADEGSWALVTGATDGIGREFANELIDRGFNILIHGRNPEKLQRVQRELQTRCPGRPVEMIAVDASRSDQPEDEVVAKVKTLPGKLTVLVNNVGGFTGRPGYNMFSDTTAEGLDSMMDLNARFPAQLTRALLPTLQESSPSLILNCGSMAGLTGVPYIVTYSGTKGFLHSFSTALFREMQGVAADGKGKVEVLALVIGNVLSASNTTDAPMFTISSSECARGCLNRVGCGEPVTYGHWRHALIIWFTSKLPIKAFTKGMLGQMKERHEEEKKDL